MFVVTFADPMFARMVIILRSSLTLDTLPPYSLHTTIAYSCYPAQTATVISIHHTLSKPIPRRHIGRLVATFASEDHFLEMDFVWYVV